MPAGMSFTFQAMEHRSSCPLLIQKIRKRTGWRCMVFVVVFVRGRRGGGGGGGRQYDLML